MKVKSILLFALTLCLMIGLCACGGDAPADNSQGSKTTQDAGNDSTTIATTTTTQAEVTTTTANPNLATYTVIVTDETGNPIPGAFVQLCLESCLPASTNAQGVATWSNKEKADYKVSFINVPAGYELPTDNFYFEKDSYEMTLVLKAVA